MASIQIQQAVNSKLHLQNMGQPGTIEIIDKPISQGGFGEIYECTAIDGSRPQPPQLVKILKDDGNGSHRRGLETVQKLQDRIIQKNQEFQRNQQKTIEQYPLLYALPQISFEGTLRGVPVLGYTANRLDKNDFIEFEEILTEPNLQAQYYRLPLKQKLGYALQLVEGMRLLRDISYIHSDINGPNLFIGFKNAYIVLIDFDSGAVTMHANDKPTTWGKPGEWVAPEIAKQLTQGNLVKVDLFTDTWSVTIAIHYLIFLRYPFFFLKIAGTNQVERYLSTNNWIQVKKTDKNFNKLVERSYDQISSWWTTKPELDNVYKRMQVAIQQGYSTPSSRPSYGQWESTLKQALNNLQHQVPPVNQPKRQNPVRQPKPQPQAVAAQPQPAHVNVQPQRVVNQPQQPTVAKPINIPLPNIGPVKEWLELVPFIIGFAAAVSVSISGLLPEIITFIVPILGFIVGFYFSDFFKPRWILGSTTILGFQIAIFLTYSSGDTSMSLLLYYWNFWSGSLFGIFNIIKRYV